MSSTDAHEPAAPVALAKPGELDRFWHEFEREWRSELWDFRVIWHEQQHDVLVREGERVVAALRLTIAASLARIDALFVVADRRRAGLGRSVLERGEELANYYNCHKVTAAVFNEHAAQRFFERCGYKVEAVLAQHTFKLDVALLRKFLL